MLVLAVEAEELLGSMSACGISCIAIKAVQDSDRADARGLYLKCLYNSEVILLVLLSYVHDL